VKKADPSRSEASRFITVLDRYRERINKALQEHMRSASDMPHEARAAMIYTVSSGGKRLRPTIVLLACQSIGGTLERALPIAIAAEMIHHATLIYDDIIDGDTVRRGQPALHVKYGQDLAIIIAGLLTTHAFFAVLDNPRVFDPLVRGMNEMGIGAVLELRGQATDVKGYVAIAERKTARLFQLAGEAGALAANATPTQNAALREYAHNLGIAFQLRDDVLDVIGTEKALGKPVGSDVRNGRPSIVSLLLCEQLDLSLPELACRAGKQFPSARMRRPVMEAIERAMALCNDYTERARTCLQTLPDSKHRTNLEMMLDYVTTRDH